MNQIKGILFNYDQAPAAWRNCFCEGCPRHNDCLRFQTGLYLPDSKTWGPAVYPTAYRNGHCSHFKEIRIIHAAYGLTPLFNEVKQKDYTPLHEQLKAYLGGHGTYYRYNSGNRLLTPEQQQWILNLFASYGYTENLSFKHYVDVLDFSN